MYPHSHGIRENDSCDTTSIAHFPAQFAITTALQIPTGLAELLSQLAYKLHHVTCTGTGGTGSPSVIVIKQ